MGEIVNLHAYKNHCMKHCRTDRQTSREKRREKIFMTFMLLILLDKTSSDRNITFCLR